MTIHERDQRQCLGFIVIGCLIYSQMVIYVESFCQSTGRYDRVIGLEQLVWLTPVGTVWFCWVLRVFARCDTHPNKMLLAVALIIIFALVAWPLRHFF
jgi:hypothetical protein